MQSKLTVLIPCKNEVANIADCIDSVAAIADEILVADSGSTDGTLECVRADPRCRLIEHPWIGYAAFKNWAIPQASHDWVLIVDADERLAPPLQEEVRASLAAADDEIDAYWIPRLTYFLGYPIRHSGWNNERVCRLIRRDRCRYYDVRVHEGIDVAPERTRRLRNRMLHYTFWDYGQYFAKLSHYAALSAEDAFEQGKRARPWKMVFSPLAIFAKTYFFKRGFLDGVPGLQVCISTAIYTFMKQARLWELHHAKKQITPDNARKQASQPSAA